LIVAKFRQAKKGIVIISCDNKNKIAGLWSQLKSNLRGKYTVELPPLKMQKLKI